MLSPLLQRRSVEQSRSNSGKISRAISRGSRSVSSVWADEEPMAIRPVERQPPSTESTYRDALMPKLAWSHTWLSWLSMLGNILFLADEVQSLQALTSGKEADEWLSFYLEFSAALLWSIAGVLLVFDIDPGHYPFCGLGKRPPPDVPVPEAEARVVTFAALYDLENRLSWMMDRNVAHLESLMQEIPQYKSPYVPSMSTAKDDTALQMPEDSYLSAPATWNLGQHLAEVEARLTEIEISMLDQESFALEARELRLSDLQGQELDTSDSGSGVVQKNLFDVILSSLSEESSEDQHDSLLEYTAEPSHSSSSFEDMPLSEVVKTESPRKTGSEGVDVIPVHLPSVPQSLEEPIGTYTSTSQSSRLIQLEALIANLVSCLCQSSVLEKHLLQQMMSTTRRTLQIGAARSKEGIGLHRAELLKRRFARKSMLPKFFAGQVPARKSAPAMPRSVNPKLPGKLQQFQKTVTRRHGDRKGHAPSQPQLDRLDENLPEEACLAASDRSYDT